MGLQETFEIDFINTLISVGFGVCTKKNYEKFIHRTSKIMIKKKLPVKGSFQILSI